MYCFCIQLRFVVRLVSTTTNSFPSKYFRMSNSLIVLARFLEGLHQQFSLNASNLPTTYPASIRASISLTSSSLSSTQLPSSIYSFDTQSSSPLPSILQPSGTKPSDKLSSNTFSSVALPPGVYPSSGLPSGVFPSGGLSSGALPSGVLPSSIFPSGVFPSGGLPTAFPSGGGTYQNTSSDRTTLDPARSASYLSFRKQAACTSSLSSFLAQSTVISLEMIERSDLLLRQ